MLGITGVYLIGEAYYVPNATGVEMVPEEDLGKYDTAELIHPNVSGIYVMRLTEDMDAAAKLQIGDIITAVMGEEIGSMNQLMGVIDDHYAGDTVTLTVYRNGRYIPVDIVLSAQADQ